MNMTNQTREARIEKMRALKTEKNLTLKEIGAMQDPPISRSRVGVLIGSRPRHLPRTTRLLDVYRFIEWFKQENDYAPSLDEIAIEFPDKAGNRNSNSAVQYWLSEMLKLEMINPRSPGAARTIVLKPLNKKNLVIKEMLRMEAESNKS